MRTRRRPAPAAESMALRVGLDGGEVERGGRGFAEARAATAAPDDGHEEEGEQDGTTIFFNFILECLLKGIFPTTAIFDPKLQRLEEGRRRILWYCFKIRPDRPNRRPPVPVYRTG